MLKLIKGGMLSVAAIFVMASVLGSLGLLSNTTYANDGSNSNKLNAINPSQYAVALSSSGNVEINLELVPDTNVIRAGKDTVTANITAPTSSTSKFHLFISSDSTTNNALSNGTDMIAATTGTMANPTSLTGNSWGYALANTTAGIATNGFDSSYTIPNPGKASKWAGVPTKGNEQMLQTLSMNQPQTTTDIYIAVSATDALTEGTYTGNIVYTAIYDSAETQEATLDKTSGTLNDTVVMTTAATVGSDSSLNNIDPGAATVKLGTQEATVTNVATTADNLVQITFTVPDMGVAGSYPVTAILNKTGETYTADTNFLYIDSTNLFDAAFVAAGKTKDPTTGFYKMQDMTSDICSSIATPSTTTTDLKYETTLVDTRDSKTYKVSKLADGKCWMTQNLDLILSDSQTFTSENTNVSESWTPSSTANTVLIPSTTKWSPSSSAPRSVRSSSDGTVSGEPGYVVSNGSTTASDDTYDTLEACTTAGHSENECLHGSRGTFYNFIAALARNSTAGTTKYTQVDTSICPKGWRLPVGDDGTSVHDGDFKTLANTYGITNSAAGAKILRETPIYIGRTGYIWSSDFTDIGVSGRYWTKTIYGSNRAFCLRFDGTFVEVQGNELGDRGRNVRCVAQ